MSSAVSKRFGGAIRWQLAVIRQAEAPAERLPGADLAPAQKECSAAGGAVSKEAQGKTRAA